MLNRVIRVSGILLAVAILSSCSTISNLFGGESPEQLEERRLESLEVPPDLASASANDSMAIPGGIGGKATYSVLNAQKSGEQIPSGQGVVPSASGVQVVKAGQKKWLVIDRKPSAVYDLVLSFLVNQDITVKSERRNLGLIDTDWENSLNEAPKNFLQSVLGSTYKDRFRIRVDRSDEPGKTELFITHYGAEKVLVEDVKSGNVIFERNVGQVDKVGGWRPRASDPEAEEELIRRFIVYLGKDQVIATQSVETPEDRGEPGHLVENDGDYPVSLVIKNRFFYSWRLVSIAIDRANFTIEDQDRTMRVFFVSYDPTAEGQKDKGFWVSLAFWQDDEEEIGPGIFQFKVIDEGASCRVIVLMEDGSPVPVELGRRMLLLLDDQL